MKTAAEWLERLRYEGQSQVCSLEPKDCREMLEAFLSASCRTCDTWPCICKPGLHWKHDAVDMPGNIP